MEKLIAKTRIGTEYMHSKQSAFFASENADKIALLLNCSGYNLSDGEAWHVYDFDYTQKSYVTHEVYLTDRGEVEFARL